jgi:hypothetical protein
MLRNVRWTEKVLSPTQYALEEYPGNGQSNGEMFFDLNLDSGMF